MKYSMYLLILCSLFFGCSKKKPTSVKVYGHAGMGLGSSLSVFHANSAEALNLANSIENCDGFEIDVRMTADSVLCLYHDSDMASQTSISGCIEDKNWSELQGLNYKGVQNQKLVSLEEVIPFFSHPETIFLDLKFYNECKSQFRSFELFEQELKALGLNNFGNIVLIVNGLPAVDYFSTKGWRVVFSSDNLESINSAIELYPKLEGVLTRLNSANDAQINQWKEKGKSVYLYDVRAPIELKKIRTLNPTGVLSDDVFGAIIELR